MLFRALDVEGDWCFGRGSQDYLQGFDACKINLSTRLKEWKNDCFFNPQGGTDFINLLDYSTKELLDKDIINTVLRSDNILKIISYTSNIVDRQLEISCHVESVFGNFIFNEVL